MARVTVIEVLSEPIFSFLVRRSSSTSDFFKWVAVLTSDDCDNCVGLEVLQTDSAVDLRKVSLLEPRTSGIEENLQGTKRGLGSRANQPPQRDYASSPRRSSRGHACAPSRAGATKYPEAMETAQG